MGINDRDYVRRDGPSFLGAFVERGTICKWLVGANVAFFLVQILAGDAFTDALLLNVDKVVFHGEVWRLLTYAFLHEPRDIFHILFNMLLLWWFGSDMEDLYGPREFLSFYLVSAVAGGLTFSLSHFLGFPGNDLCLGASGAVTAVLVLFAFHYPRRIIYVFMFLPVPIWLFVVGSVAYDAYSLLASSGRESMVAVAVHLGGAAFGYVYYKMNWRINSFVQGLWPSVTAWRRRAARPHLRVYREERPEPVRAAVASDPDEDRITDEMDAVLEKISRVGRQNLTPDELDVLQRASEILRRRRH